MPKLQPQGSPEDKHLTQNALRSTRSVIWPVWARSLNRPASATTSQTITSVSCDPDASNAPERLKRSAVTAPRWPASVT